MPPSPHYTARLPSALDARVQARVQAGTPFAVLIREALSAYLADTMPTQPPTSMPTQAPTASLTPADSADTVQNLQEQLDALGSRVAILEQALTYCRQRADIPADTNADTVPTGAYTPTPSSRGDMRQPSPQVLGLYDPHGAAVRIQVLRRDGLSYDRIAAVLQAEGIPTRYGQPWQGSSVCYLLERYGA